MGEMSDATVGHLPAEVLVHIFSFLPPEDISRAAGVCRLWSQLAENRCVWRGKSFLSEGGRRLSDVVPIARSLPALKMVSVCRNYVPNVYLNGELADFQVANLRDEVVRSAISALVTENLSIDFLLLEERYSNCLLVQLHKLKHLKVFPPKRWHHTGSRVAKLRALGSTLSREPLPNLQSVDIRTDSVSIEDEDMDSDILGALSTCSALGQVVIHTRCSLSWHTATKFLNLQSLELKFCVFEDISFLDLCPNLHILSLDTCRPLQMQELSHKSELRRLLLHNLPVNNEFLDILCCASPKLESIRIAYCRDVTHLLFLSHCPQLLFVEVTTFDKVTSRLVGLPSGLQSLSISSPLPASDTLAEIVQGLPQLKILKVIDCNFETLQFLRHCPDLTKLSLGVIGYKSFPYLYELGGLRSLKKLSLAYNDKNVIPLADVLRKMPQLEVLNVKFSESILNLSFLRYCHQLQCLKLDLYYFFGKECLCFHELSYLKELRKLVLKYTPLSVEDLMGILPNMPHLEVLGIQFQNSELNFSFLRHCSQLISLEILCFKNQRVSHLKQLGQLDCLRRLTVKGLSDMSRQSLTKQVMRMPKLEDVCLERDDNSDVLELVNVYRI